MVPVSAAISVNKHHELNHLLIFVKNSPCTIDTRGAQLTGASASAYFQRQYRIQSERIHTAEEFIRVVAAQSQRAGQYSMVECQGEPALRTSDWLQRALEVYRLQRRY